MNTYNDEEGVAKGIGQLELRLPYKPPFIIGLKTTANVIEHNKQMAKYYKQLAEYGITDEEYQYMLKIAGLKGQKKLYKKLQERKKTLASEKTL